MAEVQVLRARIGEFVDPIVAPAEPDRRHALQRAPSAGQRLRLSAVMATYQGALFVREQLRSMLEQTVPLDEIIIADDCSSDATLQIVEEVKADSSIPIRILRSDSNLGVGRNFERALRAATGDIVFLADQDDTWRPDKVGRMLKEFALRPDLNVLFTNAQLINDAGVPLNDTLFQVLRVAHRERYQLRNGTAFDALLRRNLATGATMAIRRPVLLSALPIPPEWLHDEWIAMIASACGRIDFLDETLTDYRQHDNNHVGSQRETFLSTLEKLKRCRRQSNWRLARRTQTQIERLRLLDPPVAQWRIDAAAGKLRHLQRRCRLPANRLARVPAILAELMNGGYRRYSSGWRAVAGDLFGTIRRDPTPS